MNHPFHFFPEKETGLNIDIIFYPVNNIVAAIWNIYSLKLKNIYFLFFNTERLQQLSHIVCVPVPRLSQPCRNFYQFHVFSVHTSQGRLCPSMSIQKSLQGRDNLPCGRGVVCPLSVQTLTTWCWPPEARGFYSLSSPSILCTSLPIACSAVKVFITWM